MIDFHSAVRKLHPEIVVTVGDLAYNEAGNEIAYDKAAVEDKIVELKAEAQAAVVAQEAARQSALAKLKKLGLTEEEALALGVTK